MFGQEITESDLLFWGEWEAPSQRLFSWDPHGALPQNLVRPIFPGNAIPSIGLQNTDPYVFGDSFKYTLCKQSKRTGKATYLANLAPGTLILFGSKLQGQFVLDTAFVVDEYPIAHSAENWETELAHLSPTYRAVTLEPMYWDKNTKAETTFCLYSGARIDKPINGTYSFFPCLHSTNDPTRFERPVIDIPGVINHSLMMNSKGTEMSHAEIAKAWKLVVDQVQNQGLRLGLSAHEPQKSEAPEHLWPH